MSAYLFVGPPKTIIGCAFDVPDLSFRTLVDDFWRRCVPNLSHMTSDVAPGATQRLLVFDQIRCEGMIPGPLSSWETVCEPGGRGSVGFRVSVLNWGFIFGRPTAIER